jgi:hypothetical protein
MTRNAAVWNFEKAPYSHLGIKTKLRNVATWCRSLPSQNKSGNNNIIYSINKMNLNKSTKQLALSKEMSCQEALEHKRLYSHNSIIIYSQQEAKISSYPA